MGIGAWGNGDVAPPRRCKPLGGTDGPRPEGHLKKRTGPARLRGARFAWALRPGLWASPYSEISVIEAAGAV